MLRRIGFVVLAMVAAPASLAAQQSVELSADVAALTQSVPGFSVEVTLKSRLAAAVDVFPEAEAGQFPDRVRVVQSLRIRVNGRELFVPRSVFADLSWVTAAEVAASKSSGRLTVRGGDASESYFVRIEFDTQALRSRSLYSSLIPNAPMQQTRYFSRSGK
jgi:hypothetical protein